MLITWLMIFFVVVMVFGPIMMLRPTPGMNRLAKLRTLASQAGLTVRIPSKKDFPEKGAIYALPIPESVRKKKSLTHWCLKKRNQEHDIHFHGVWDWEGEGRPDVSLHETLVAMLDRLPKGSGSFELNAYGIGCFWDEKCRGKSEKDAIDEIVGLLSQMMQALEK